MSDRAFLFLVVDAVPFDLAREVWTEGGLPGFAAPRPMVSVFPSLTNVAVGALLRGVFDEVPLGYVARYLDLASGQIHGGFSDPNSESMMGHLHGSPHGFLEHIAMYFLRGPLVHGQVRWITRAFLRHDSPWLAYIPATDGVGHFGGRVALARAFRDVCASVATAREEQTRRTGIAPGVVLCSDHGMAFGRFSHLSSFELAMRLRAAGFEAGDLRGGGFVLVPYGDVGGGVVYCDRTHAESVAETVAAAPGVDLAFALAGDGCVVFGRRDEGVARASVSWRGDRYRYEHDASDPLGYGPIWQRLERDGKLHDGWADDADLRAATWHCEYPDALARVRHGLGDIVRMPAPVIFSMKQTWTYGPPLTHLGAELMGGQIGTHGALAAAESVGFAICTAGDEPEGWLATEALRPQEVLRPWRELVRAGRADVS